MISILMPIYNGIEFIDESIGSILKQTYTNWELIIGINGHPENSETLQKALKYANKLPYKIIVKDLFHIKGKAEALNNMIQYCNHNYIALLDVDDIWHPRKLEIQKPFISNYDVIGTKCVYFGDTNATGIIPKIPEGDFSQFDFFEYNPIINSSVIIRKDYCYWNSKWFGIEDYDLWLSLRIKKCKFYNCSEIAVKHRIHPESAFNANGNSQGVPELLEFWKNKN